jgi:uncharacterized protein
VQLGIARAVAAILFAIVIGLVMHLIFGRNGNGAGFKALPDSEFHAGRTMLLFGAMMAVLVFANWASVSAEDQSIWAAVAAAKWWLTGGFAALLAVVLVFGFRWRPIPLVLVGAVVLVLASVAPHEPQLAFLAGMAGLVIVAMKSGDDAEDWLAETWSFAKQILPLLLAGVFVAGFLLGRPGAEGLIPPQWIATAVGGEGLGANLFASVVGSLMYFATLTEVPIVQALRGAGMGEGPSLALLLAGPALSLPNMLAIRSIMGTARTTVYVALVVVMATLSGLIYGSIFG